MPSASTLKFPENLTIENVERVREEALGAIRNINDIELDMTGTKRVDTAGIQLAVTIRLHLLSENISSTWVGVTDEAREKAKTLGLLESLGWECH